MGGIKEDTEEEHIRDVFKNFGEIESIEVSFKHLGKVDLISLVIFLC